MYSTTMLGAGPVKWAIRAGQAFTMNGPVATTSAAW
jgi:hypothetical protein